MTRDRAWLRSKYLSLGTGEITAAAVFAVVAYLISSPNWPADASKALWSALIPLLSVLIQAGIYWLLARSWVAVASMPRQAAGVYRALNVVNLATLVLALVAIAVWWPSSTAHAALVIVVWLFGVIEYVNYFHVRLAYPASRWFASVRQWRTPQLMKDVRGVDG